MTHICFGHLDMIETVNNNQGNLKDVQLNLVLHSSTPQLAKHHGIYNTYHDTSSFSLFTYKL